MPCMQAIKNMLNKTTFNFDRTDVDLYNFHPQLQIILAMNGLFFKERSSIFRFVWPGLIMCNSIIWLVFEIIFIMHFLHIKDYSHATECFCYFVILGCVPVVLVSIFLNKELLYAVVEKMNNDFLVIRNLGPRYRAVRTVSSVYGPPLCYQVMFTSIAICLIAYQIAEKLEYWTFDVLFLSLGAAACLQLWIPCYLGTRIRDKAFAVGDAAWECGWHLTTLGLLVRNDILIIVSRAQQPVTIKFTGLPDINLQTFSSLMSISYSYFNMVRQYSQ